jgi:riboflavin synthase
VLVSLPMFTGLVETTGKLKARERRGPGFRLKFATELGPLALGESIAVSGVCLTVSELDAAGFSADVSVETAERTTLGRVPLESALNLERSLRVGDRLGGHLVTGHVDAVARVVSVEPAGEARRVQVRVPEPLLGLLAPKGSVALDGVSLTVNGAKGDRIELMLIPHTLGVTNLSSLAPGRELNLEVDLVARYVVRFLSVTGGGADHGLAGALARAGFQLPERQ